MRPIESRRATGVLELKPPLVKTPKSNIWRNLGTIKTPFEQIGKFLAELRPLAREARAEKIGFFRCENVKIQCKYCLRAKRAEKIWVFSVYIITVLYQIVSQYANEIRYCYLKKQALSLSSHKINL